MSTGGQALTRTQGTPARRARSAASTGASQVGDALFLVGVRVGVQHDDAAERGERCEHCRACADDRAPPGCGLRPCLGMQGNGVPRALETPGEGHGVVPRRGEHEEIPLLAGRGLDGRLHDRQPRGGRGQAQHGRAGRDCLGRRRQLSRRQPGLPRRRPRRAPEGPAGAARGRCAGARRRREGGGGDPRSATRPSGRDRPPGAGARATPALRPGAGRSRDARPPR